MKLGLDFKKEIEFEYVEVDGVKVPIIGEIDSKTEKIKFYEKK